jgi:hypothetical protein
MTVIAVQSSPAAQNQAAVKAAPRQNPAPPQASVPQDRVTISPQAHAQFQAQAHAQTVSSDKDHDGDKK